MFSQIRKGSKLEVRDGEARFVDCGEAQHLKPLGVGGVGCALLEGRMACGEKYETVYGEALQHLAGDCEMPQVRRVEAAAVECRFHTLDYTKKRWAIQVPGVTKSRDGGVLLQGFLAKHAPIEIKYFACVWLVFVANVISY